MSKKFIFILFTGVLALSMGCSRKLPVFSTEGSIGAPYKELGTLQVHLPARDLLPSNLMWGGVEAATLTFAPTPSGEDQYKKALQKELVRVAKKRYRADAVIEITYWPDLTKKRFPEGKIYARGKMIKFEKFPASKVSTTSPQPAATAAA